jgi:hypothetical protein
MSTRGRPILYKAENAEPARKFCMLGATNEDLARCFEVSRSTIDNWIDTIAEFVPISPTTAEDAAARRGVGRSIRRSPSPG